MPWSCARIVVWVAAATILIAGCTSKPEAGVPDASVAAVEMDAGAAPAAPVELKFTVESEFPDGGTAPIPFELGVKPKIDPTQDLSIRANLALRNVRIRVFDEADKAMVSDDALRAATPEVPFDYRIHFPTPLKSGHRYSLVIDAQSGALFSDGLGRDQPDQRLELQVLGEREKAAPVKRAKGPKRHRR